MSKKEIRNDVIAERDELAVMVEAHADDMITARAEMQSKIDEIQTALDVSVALVAEHAATIQAKDEAFAELSEKNGELEELIVDGSDDLEAVQAELETARAALANPAIADAVLKNVTEDGVPAADVDAEADALELLAKAKLKEDEEDSPKNILEEYEAMASGPERIAFLQKNERAIYACMNHKEG